MIRNKTELRFYIAADNIMNEQVFPQIWIKKILFPSPIQKFLKILRITEYYHYKKNKNKLYIPLYLYYKIRYEKLKIKTRFDIPINTLGYGCRIGHLSNIIINGSTKIGNYCSLQNNIVIADGNPKQIGNHVQISSNTVIAKKITIADGCTLSANSFLNKSIVEKYSLWGGVPAIFLKNKEPWTKEEPYYSEFLKCESLRQKLKIES